MKRALGFSVLGVAVLFLSQACGSDDPKNADKNVRYEPGSGGEGGDNSAGGSSSDAGQSSGATGTGATGASSTGATGTGAASGSGSGGEGAGGDSNTTGGVGSGGTPGGGGDGNQPDECPAGTDECDGDLTDLCEQNINVITACGDCDTQCSSDNGTPACQQGTCVYQCNAGFDDCNDDGADGCEADLTDDTSCGSCGRNCAALGATCVAGKCSDIPMQTGVIGGSWTFNPLGLLSVSGGAYTIHRYPLNGSAVQTIWAPTNKYTNADPIITVGDIVYWFERGTGGDDFTSAVFSKAITADAGTQPDLAWVPEWTVAFLRRQGNAFYWFSGDYQSGDPSAWIYTRAINAGLEDHGTKIMAIDQGTHNGITGFNVTSDALYWVSTKDLAATPYAGTPYELRTAPIGGGTPSVVPAPAGGSTTAVSGYYGVPALVAVGNTIYFNRQTGEAIDGIYSFKVGQATPTRLVTATNVRDFVVDATSIYYMQQNVQGVWKAPVTGGAGVQISTGTTTRILAHDDQFVYVLGSSELHKVIK